MSADIRLVYPRPDQLICESSTFLLGAVPPGATLTIQDEAVPVSGQGFFCHALPLSFGANVIRLEGRSGETSFSRTLNLLRQMPLEMPPAGAPLEVNSETLRPDQDCILQPGDWVPVSVLANPGVVVTARIAGALTEPVLLSAEPLPEWVADQEGVFAELHQTRPLIPAAGYYQGFIRIPPAFSIEKEGLAVEITLTRGDESLTVICPGRISITSQSVLARVVTDDAILRTAPQAGARLTPQHTGTTVAVNGRFGDWARIRLGTCSVGFMAVKDLAWLDAAYRAPVFLEMIKTAPLDAWSSELQLILQAGIAAGPVEIRVDAALPNRVIMRLYDTVSRCDFIQYHPDEDLIDTVQWQGVDAETLDVIVDLKKPLSGYTCEVSETGWTLACKTLSDKPVEEICILIDPGHGGEETGATGPDGQAEKDLNLSVSKTLAEALAAKGFMVRLTRDQDQTLSLPARARQVLETDADLLLSIHHNALPDGREPSQHEGAGVYYYHPFAKPLAQIVLQGLVASGRASDGLLYDSLAMTRIHAVPSLLIELGFMTHPYDYETLIDPTCQREACTAIADALASFFA